MKQNYSFYRPLEYVEHIDIVTFDSLEIEFDNFFYITHTILCIVYEDY